MRAAMTGLALLACACHTTFDVTGDTVTDPGTDAGDVAGDAPADAVDAVHDVAVDDGPDDWHGECRTDLDCPGTRCVRVPDEPGGYWICESRVREEATECSSPEPWVDMCCTSDECTEGEAGGCFFTEGGWGFCGGAIMEHNTCIYDECARDADCPGGPGPAGMCIPALVGDWPRSRCVWAWCRTASDCTREPGGFCAPIFDFCCPWSIQGFFCVYPGSCQSPEDCPGYDSCVGDVETGETVCDMWACPG